mgnify:CR=1 FL=1
MRVLLIDDHALFRVGLLELLERRGNNIRIRHILIKPEITQADLDHTARFLRWLARGDENARHTFQTFPDKGDNYELTRILHGPPRAQLRRLERLNVEGAGAFVMVNRGDGRGRKRENVLEVTHAFIDQDAPPTANVYDFVAPHATVQTSSRDRLQHYWRVTDVPLEAFAPMQRGLARTFGTDESVTDLSRVLRLPGFWHQKSDPVQCRARHLDYNAVPLTLPEILDAFPLVREALQEAQEARQRPAAPRRTPSPDDVSTFPEKLLSVVERKAATIGETGRHKLLVWIARTCLDNGLSEGDAEALTLQARDLLPDRKSGPVPDREVQDVVAWVFQTLSPGDPWTSQESPQAYETSHDGLRGVFTSLTRQTRNSHARTESPDPTELASIFQRLRGPS